METVLISLHCGWSISIHCTKVRADLYTSVALVTAPGDIFGRAGSANYMHSTLLSVDDDGFLTATLSNLAAPSAARRYVESSSNRYAESIF